MAESPVAGPGREQERTASAQEGPGPQDSASRGPAQGEPVPDDSTLGESTLGDSTPGGSVPTGSTLGGSTLGGSAPRESTPRESTLRESLSAAARKAGIGQVAPGEVPTAASLLRAIGGVRGLIEAILPGLVFLVARAFARTTLTSAIAGLIGIAISAVFALMTGKAADNFVPGLVINVVSLVALLVSLAVRWPVIGIIVGLLTNEGTAWRGDKAKRRVLTIATWLWVGLFGFRLAVQVPLYFANLPDWQAATKLLMGIPLYAAVLWVTWLLVRAVYRRVGPAV